jgi:hypothetical protein
LVVSSGIAARYNQKIIPKREPVSNQVFCGVVSSQAAGHTTKSIFKMTGCQNKTATGCPVAVLAVGWFPEAEK